ncbi:protein involved in gliding motility GldB [Zobellia uliginosa]|uniref:Protein involved in gliding motility GldB n=1 Tax=Zobellia uliginosa TaxID=143224 RepID=A0ABY1L2X4_9FLAO|nr:gliding motility lipoprotein GldB [Zobellia uliginosa]SIS93809.1 protein involved in gliding motility GldB [Zobellia uliginosa]
MRLNIEINRKLLSKLATFFVIFIISTSFIGCKESVKLSEDVKKIKLDVQIDRFDKEFAAARPEDLPVLKKKYPYLFPKQYSDSVWVAKMQDTIQVELLDEVEKAFSDFSEEEQSLELLFKHIKYYFPQFDAPKVVTVTSDVDYSNRVILTDTLLLIGLDNYLGPDHRFYVDIQKYIRADLDKRYLTVDVASAFAKKVVPAPNDRSFLAQMIYYGKELYLKDRLLPLVTEAQRINYSEEQLAWAIANEEPIWRNFIEREYLYSTDNKLGPRFLDLAPFSKFGLELDNESPGRIGRFIGWQIVRAFMDRNELSLQQMLNLPAEEIFKKSNYKPKK